MQRRKYKLEFEIHHNQPQSVVNDILFELGRKYTSLVNPKITGEVSLSGPCKVELWAFTDEDLQFESSLQDLHDHDDFTLEDVDGKLVHIYRNGVVDSKYMKDFKYEVPHPKFSEQPVFDKYDFKNKVVSYRKVHVDQYGYFAGFVEEQ